MSICISTHTQTYPNVHIFKITNITCKKILSIYKCLVKHRKYNVSLIKHTCDLSTQYFVYPFLHTSHLSVLTIGMLVQNLGKFALIKHEQ